MKASRFFIIVLSVLTLLSFSGCSDSESEESRSGILQLNLADAPILDDSHIEGVYITINGIEYHTDGGWEAMEEFNTSRLFNLFDLRDGNFTTLGSFVLPSGHYTQIRFMLDAPADNGQQAANPGCYIKFDDNTTESLFVPSGAQTGYKATGSFDVPIDANVTITADFDVRKSVTVTGSGKYKLKPTIRLVVHDEAGKINGTLTNMPEGMTYVVYAYAEGTWDANETADPVSDGVRFPNAVNSSTVKGDGTYVIAFLAEGTYDLVVARYESGSGDYLGYAVDGNATVNSGETTGVSLDASALVFN